MTRPSVRALPVAPTPPSTRGSVRLTSGRLISRTIDEPEIKQAIEKKLAELKSNPEALHNFLVERGFITRAGKLPKRYGG